MDDGLTTLGLSVTCEACESDLDFVDAFAEVGVCRQCGIAFLVDHTIGHSADYSVEQDLQPTAEGRF